MPSVRQAVDSTYIGIVVGTLTALVLVLVLITVLVLQRRRICKHLISIPTLNDRKVSKLYEFVKLQPFITIIIMPIKEFVVFGNMAKK